MNTDQPALPELPKEDNTGSERLSKKGMIWFFVIQCVILIIALLSLLDIGAYGWSLFAVIPFSMGITIGTFTRIYRAKRFLKGTLITLAAIVVLSVLLIAAGIEGAICVLMALGIIVVPTVLGMVVGYLLRNMFRIYVSVFILMLNSSFITYDFLDESKVVSIAVESVTINASREKIWNILTHGVDFRQNTNMFFQAGVNYPRSMELQYTAPDKCYLICTLSAGHTALEVDRLDSLKSIRFRVPEKIIPMKELSLYDSVEAPHLQGYFKPEWGEFAIESINDSQCRLVAATSYSYKITPVFYWRWWSDYLVNTMHRHVLNDIRALAEEETK